MSLGNTAFSIGRRIGKHSLAGRIFCLTERWLPLERVARTRTLVAFHHPRPVANPHVLIVPTRPISSLTSPSVPGKTRAEVIWSMLTLARQVGSDLDPDADWQMVINGGTRQEIGQLHGHLLLDHAAAGEDGVADSPASLLPFLDQLQSISLAPNAGYSLVMRWTNGGETRVTISTEG